MLHLNGISPIRLHSTLTGQLVFVVRRSFFFLSLTMLCVCTAVTSGMANGPDLRATPKFFQDHCFRCHSETNGDSDFRLDNAPSESTDDAFGPIWARALERINSGEMPPKEEPQPNAEERYAATDWISRSLQDWDAAQNGIKASISFKRLTRVEYVNTLNDLLGFTYYPSDPGGLPEDPSWHGIERMGSVLSLTPSHLERYLAAAELALHQTMPLSEPPPPWRFEWTAAGIINWSQYQQDLKEHPDTTPRHRLLIGPANNWKHYVGGIHQVVLPRAGYYRVRVGGSGLRPPGGSLPHVVMYDATIDRTLLEQDLDAPENQPTEIEATVWLPQGAHDLILRNELPGPSPYGPYARGGNVDLFTSLKAGRSPFLQKLSNDNYEPYVPMLILDYVVIEAVIDPWPPIAQKSILFDGERDTNHASVILHRFAERAFRRPVSDEELTPYVRVAESAQASGMTFEESIRESLVSMLCAHDFLFLVEGSSDAHRDNLNAHELASRLSYFLWSTMPDAELFASANSAVLFDSHELSRQCDRLLADARSKNFANDFSRQWLRLGEVGKFPPDKKLYPTYDAGLERSMIRESQAYFEHVLRDNRSIREFLDSNWTMLNNRLADHYGIDGIADFDLKQKVQIQDSHRGGLLTQASILSLTSDGFRQRPVHRGKWISEVIYGVSPPPPPPNAGSIPTPVEGQAKLSLRQRLELHRTNSSCAACHARIDPLGFAFENYDAIGQWRTHDNSMEGTGDAPIINAGDTLADGRSYNGIAEFKKCLLEDTDTFAIALTEKLATYALRRGLTYSDKLFVRKIVEQSKADDYRLQTLVKRLVTSELFLRR